MQKHIKIYLDAYGENTICQYCGLYPVTDVHHIEYRSHFGKKTKDKQDDIGNLIGLCRDCHDRAHFKKEPYITKEQLLGIV